MYQYLFPSAVRVYLLNSNVFFPLSGKSIDFHQLDFDALKSPVCSDITESGEPISLKVSSEAF